jgi:hypothetical protein
MKTIHGLGKHPLYGTYKQMMARCFDPSSKKYKFYGGRGISVCDEWKNAESGLQAFIQWADKNGRTAGLELDRIDNSEDYSPGNCRFSNRQTQNRNTRSNTRISFNGEEMLFIECFERFGKRDIPYNTAWTRFYKGWSVEDAISKPLQRRR